MKTVYKLLTINEWEIAQKNGFIQTALDQKDGYIHLSTSRQLPLTLKTYFDDENKIILLAIPYSKIKNSVKFENTAPYRKGEFPHLYNKLDINIVEKNWVLEKKQFGLPQEILIKNDS